MKIIGDSPVRIGNSFHCAEECYVISQNHDYNHGNCVPYDSQRYIEKETIIEDAVLLGVGVVVLGGTHIGEGAIIQTGSVVVGDIPPYAMAGGHPAKVFKYRGIEHYEKLKKDGKFLKV